MRLFRVESEWTEDDYHPETGSLLMTESKCMRVTHDGQQPVLRVGGFNLPVSKSLAAPFEQAAPLVSLPILAAGLSTDDPRRLTRPSRREVEYINNDAYYGPALVHTCIPAYPGGRVRLRATCFGEREVEGRHCAHVEREYLPLTDAGGLVVHHEEGGEALLEMLPASAFRVEHEEPFVPQGESPVLVVAWSGRELRVFRPQKFKGNGPKRRQYKRPRSA
jgi:hypothetical protein